MHRIEKVRFKNPIVNKLERLYTHHPHSFRCLGKKPACLVEHFKWDTGNVGYVGELN